MKIRKQLNRRVSNELSSSRSIQKPLASETHFAPTRQGLAMAATVITVFATGAMVAVLLSMATSENRFATVERDVTVVEYLAEGALDVASSNLLSSLTTWKWPASEMSVSVGDKQVQVQVLPTGSFGAQTESSGIQTFQLTYALTTEVDSGNAKRTLRRIYTATATPIFQFAVFYDQDLEVHPGPNMTLGGRVHSNRDIYLSTAGSKISLDTNYVRAVGDIYRGRKNSVNSSAGVVDIRRWVENPWDPAAPKEFVKMPSQVDLYLEGLYTPSGYDSSFKNGWDKNADGDFDDIGEYMPFVDGSLEMWGQPDDYALEGHTVLTGEHGLGTSSVPAIGSIQQYVPVEAGQAGDYTYDEATGIYSQVATGTGTHTPGMYNSLAGLKILIKNDNTVQVFSGGTDVTSLIGSIVSLTEIYDAREANGKNELMTVASLDLAALNTSGYFPANGLLYCAKEGAASGVDAGGLYLFNGQQLAAPLTCVSEGALYVKGDFNTISKKPSSVIADAVNLLSNSWTNTKTPGTLPWASETTYNMALITGAQESSGSNYSGGLENLPRFHENWTGKTARLSGSLVSTWLNNLCTGKWVYGGDRYQAPHRDWTYDTNFNNMANLPPYTPMAIEGRPVVTWTP
jgi:hypothetical protein